MLEPGAAAARPDRGGRAGRSGRPGRVRHRRASPAGFLASAPPIDAGGRGRAHQDDPADQRGHRAVSSDDPVRVYQQFATLDLLSGGRAEIMAGRGSFIESFPLFGYDLDDYDELFAEKLELLLQSATASASPGRAGTARRCTTSGVYPRTLRTEFRSGSRSAATRPRRSAPARSACRWRWPSSAACRSVSRRSSICFARPPNTPATTRTHCRSASTPTAIVADTSQRPPTSSFRATPRR